LAGEKLCKIAFIKTITLALFLLMLELMTWRQYTYHDTTQIIEYPDALSREGATHAHQAFSTQRQGKNQVSQGKIPRITAD
jgi:hypothetical protein